MSKLSSMDRAVGPFPILWEVTYDTDDHVRRDAGCGDTEYSHTEVRRDVFHIIAPNEAMAIMGFRNTTTGRLAHIPVECRALLVVNAEICVNRLDWR